MSDTTLIAVGIGAVAAVSVTLGHVLGEQRRHREVEAAMTRQLASYEALLHALAEDYDPPEQPDERHRGKLPPGWAVIEGGGMGALVALVVAWLRRLRPGIVGATATAGAVAAIVAVALLGNGATPPVPRQTGRTPYPARTAGTAYITPGAPPYTQTPPPPPHGSGTPVLPVVPQRTPHASSPPPTTASAPARPTPARSTTPRPPSPSRSPVPPTRTPSPPTAGCPVDLTLVLLGVGVYVCV